MSSSLGRPSLRCTRLAAEGDIEGLKRARSCGAPSPWREETTRAAARGGHVECLRHLHEHGCAWNENVCLEAATFGHMVTLRYALDQGCPVGWRTLAAAMDGRREECIELLLSPESPYIEKTPSVWAAAAGHSLELLKTMRIHHKECVRDGLALKRRRLVGWDAATAEAAMKTSLQTFKYVLAEGCDVDARACAAAASVSIEALAFAHESGVQWDARTCAAAAEAGRIDCLRYAQKFGCPLDSTSISYGNDAACMEFALDHGSGWRSTFLLETALHNDIRTFEWALARGAPSSVLWFGLAGHGPPHTNSALWRFLTTVLAFQGNFLGEAQKRFGAILLKEHPVDDNELQCWYPPEKRLFVQVRTGVLFDKWRWSTRVRPYALHWIEQRAVRNCGPIGKWREADLEVIGASLPPDGVYDPAQI